MGKRKRDKSNEDLPTSMWDEHDDPDCCSEYIEEDYEASQDGHVAIDAQNQEELAGVNQLASVVTVPVTIPCSVEDPTPIIPDVIENVPTVPAEILLALGEAKKSEEGIGKKIPVEISERLGKILIEGLTKEQKEALLTKILIPENFQMARAPKLNAEVAAVLTESAKNRDKRLQKSQNQLGTGIAGLVNLIADLIEGQINNTEVIKRISEVNQILLDMHHEETMNRRRLIIPLLDKSFWNIIHGVKRDEFLFGDNLNENIKVSKIIEKAGQQIKKPITASTSKKPFQQQGNLQRPPRPGTTRTFHVQAPPPPPPSRYYREAPPPAPAPTRRQAPSTATRSRGGHQSRPYDKRHRR
ncbi:hypothetical protein ACJJTC_015920 [Scirpophaga incertulas]